MPNSSGPSSTKPAALDRTAWRSRLPPYRGGLHGTLRTAPGEWDLVTSGSLQYRYLDVYRELVMRYSMSAPDSVSPDFAPCHALVIQREWLDGAGLFERSGFDSAEVQEVSWISIRRNTDGTMVALSCEGAGEIVRRELPRETLLPAEAISLLLDLAIRGVDEARCTSLHPMDSSHASLAVSHISPYEGPLNIGGHAAWAFVTSHAGAPCSTEMPEATEWAVMREDGVLLACSLDTPDLCWSFQLVAPRIIDSTAAENIASH
jgi:hypothetical protein